MASSARKRKRRRQRLRNLQANGNNEIPLPTSSLEHLLLRLTDDTEREKLKQRVKEIVEEQIANNGNETCEIFISNLAYTLGRPWRQITTFFQQYGPVRTVKLIPGRNGRSSGCAVVRFEDSRGVSKVMGQVVTDTMAAPRLGGTAFAGAQSGQLSCGLGHRGFIRVRPNPPKRSDLQEGATTQLLDVDTVHLGNYVTAASLFNCHLTFHNCAAALRIQNKTLQLILRKNDSDTGLHRDLYRFDFRIKDIRGHIQVHEEGGRASMLITLRHRPRVFRSIADLADTIAAGFVSGYQREWMRTVDFTGQTLNSCFTFSLSLHQQLSQLRLSRSTLEHLWHLHLIHFTDRHTTVRVTQAHGWQLWDVNHQRSQPDPQSTGEGTGLHSILVEALMSLSPAGRVTEQPKDVLVGAVRSVELPAWLTGQCDEVQYLVLSLLSQGFVYQEQLTAQMCTAILTTPPDVAVKALGLMLDMQYHLNDPLTTFRKCCNDVLSQQSSAERSVPTYCQVVRRVVLTPTSVLAMGWETEVSNRVIRKFEHHRDRFVRVTVGEENAAKLMNANGDDADMDDVYKRALQALVNGIQIGDRVYHFLAYSSSQLKDNSWWAFAATDNTSAASIRQWMGDFSSIRVAAKYAARMGQCFSSTFTAANLQLGDVRVEDDVVRGDYCFTDGVGRISLGRARQVAAQLAQQKRIPGDYVPSAFQIRCQGFKGVLTVDPRLVRNRIVMRTSMKKFDVDQRSFQLEVVTTSKYMTGYLNHFIIMLLSSLGVPDEVFINMQRDMVQQLNEMLENEETALRVLSNYGGADGAVLDCLQNMLMAGFRVEEPFLAGMLRAIRTHLLQNLLHKMRIFVPKSCVLIGVVDDTGVLEYGQIFVRFRKPVREGLTRYMTEDEESHQHDPGAPVVLQRRVMVTRHPCQHPGDIRVLQAVDCPSLRHLENVVVFPRNGPRPHPNEMSGGDLDGDIYFICWDEYLFPPEHMWNQEPLDYTPPPPKEVSDTVTMEDIARFFVSFMQNDSLGAISNAWLAFADASEQGAFDGRCLRLAKLHSIAVDFAKSGIPASREKDLKPMQYPDWMQKKDKTSYKSHKVLGRMFRHLLSHTKDTAEEAQEGRAGQQQFKIDESLLVEGIEDEAFMQRAQLLYHEYESDVVRLMNRFGVRSEAEIISGCITKFINKFRKKKERNYEVRQQVAEAARTMRLHYLKQFEEAVGIADDTADMDGGTWQKAIKFASAWYYAAYEQYDDVAGDQYQSTHQHAQTTGMGTHFFGVRTTPRRHTFVAHSFPWVLHNWLCMMKRESQAGIESEEATSSSGESEVE